MEKKKKNLKPELPQVEQEVVVEDQPQPKMPQKVGVASVGQTLKNDWRKSTMYKLMPLKLWAKKNNKEVFETWVGNKSGKNNTKRKQSNIDIAKACKEATRNSKKKKS